FYTMDGSPSAHFENTVLITESEPEILTKTRSS
ncbi:MAG: type I methionyl aminopeptidase, partial [Candidatus Celaenobacter antarcticus]|nr:type I methionyl aminopeptidase [Candidatus Celaenobacter antarcticus]